MRITGLKLLSNQLDSLRDFYTRVLDLKLIDASAEHFSLQAGWTRITFKASDTPLIGHYHFAFNIPEAQFAEAKAWIQERVSLLSAADAPRITSFDFQSWNAHALYFRDAEGNILEFIARHNLRHDRSTAFSGDNLLCVSEIGLASSCVVCTVDEIAKLAGIRAWRGAGSETFTAVGDEEGLFIVVEEGRSWRPTNDTPALPLPTQIEIAGLEERIEIPRFPYILLPSKLESIPALD